MKLLVIFISFTVNLDSSFSTNSLNIDSDFVRFIKNKNIKKIALAPFRKNGNINKTEVKYIQDSFLRKVTETLKLEIVELNLDDTDFDIIITGDIYKTIDSFDIFLKLIEPKTKNITKVFKASFPKIIFEEEFWKIDFEDLKSFNDQFLDDINFRYSISQDCQSKVQTLINIQQKTLELKARYIVWKFKNDPTLIKKIKRNPGSEFINRDDKKRFYYLLEKYWSENVEISDEELKNIQKIMTNEEQILNECGWR